MNCSISVCTVMCYTLINYFQRNLKVSLRIRPFYIDPYSKLTNISKNNLNGEIIANIEIFLKKKKNITSNTISIYFIKFFEGLYAFLVKNTFV